MTSSVSILDVYNVISSNDVAALEKAIFFLGVRIHDIRGWNNKSPLFYAAWLGHLDLVKILISDMMKYWRNFLDQDQWLREAVKHFPTQKEAVSELVELLTAANGAKAFFGPWPSGVREEVIAALIAEDVLELIADVLHRDGQDDSVNYVLFGAVAEYCVEKRRALSGLSLWVQEKEEFMNHMESEEIRNPILIAMMKGKTESVKELIEERNIVDGMLSYIASIGNPTILEAMLEEPTIHYTLTVTGVKSINDLLLNALKFAEDNESCNIIETILSHEKFDCRRANWFERYYNLLLKGKVKSASCIKHMVDFSDEQERDILRDELKNCKLSLEDLRFLSVKDFMDVINTFLSLDYDLTDSPLGKQIQRFPMNTMRPDLVGPLSEIISLEYSSSDVLNTDKSLKYMLHPEILAHCDRVYFNMDFSHMRFVAAMFLGTEEELEWYETPEDFPTPYYMTEYDKEDYVEVKAHVARIAVLETGKPLYAREDKRYEGKIEDLVKELESSRLQQLTLKKLCRLSIRKSIIDQIEVYESGWNRWISFGKVMDRITSLYVDGNLPKCLVDYLLYRGGSRDLYHWLISPSEREEPDSDED